MDKTNAAIGLGLLAQIGPAAMNNMKTQPVQSDVSFSETLMKTSEASANPADKSRVMIKNENNPNKPDTDTNSVKAVDNGNSKVENTETANTGSKTDVTEENRTDSLKEKVSEAIDEIKEKIKSEFNVTDEEIEDAMEVLMLTVTDLLNSSDLKSLMMQLTGTTDSIELLTNVELYDGIKEVSALADSLLSEISEEVSLTKDEVKEIISDESFELKTDADEEMLGEIQNLVMGENVKVAGTEKNNTEIVKAVEETDTDYAGKSETVRKTEGTAKEAKNLEVTVNVEKDENSTKIETVKTETNSQNDNSKDNKNGMNQAQAPAIVQNIEQTVNTVGDVVETVTSYTDTENVFRQVTNHVKVNITADSTEMEMQLHPASLGTVNMQIGSQNGEITARFTVQNELVKSILENQMISLQETLIEQGTKVSAIEITVASYNLDSGKNDGYSEERQKNEERSSKRRGINLNEIDSFDELTDEERLTAEIMNMNGSSVNYKA